MLQTHSSHETNIRKETGAVMTSEGMKKKCIISDRRSLDGVGVVESVTGKGIKRDFPEEQGQGLQSWKSVYE